MDTPAQPGHGVLPAKAYASDRAAIKQSSSAQFNQQLLSQLLTTTQQPANDFIAQNINASDISQISAFDAFNGSVTPIGRPAAHAENPFQGMYKPVITENADLEEVSNALLQLAQQNERSEGNRDAKPKNDNHSLFSSFM